MNGWRTSSVVPAVVFTVAVLAAAGCQQEGTQGDFEWKPVYGDGFDDSSPVIARVGEITITERDLEQHLAELRKARQQHYSGPEGERLLLSDMVDELLLVEGAVEEELFRDPDVARDLISTRRAVLSNAMTSYGLLRDRRPTEEELRQFFEDNRANYRQQGLVAARHIACATQADAQAAYQRILDEDQTNSFAYACGDLSINRKTAERHGEVGWFSRGGFIPDVVSGKKFSETVFDWDIGLHPPVKIGDRWHVVEILRRQEDRGSTFAEARDRALNDMLPAYQDAIVKDYLRDRRENDNVVFLGRFAPGEGVSAEDLFQRAVAIQDPDRQFALFRTIYNDYPDHERADDALFLSASLALDNWRDHRVADRYLEMLINDYPDSPLVDDAKVMRENLYNPDFFRPESIEQLLQQ